jgi:RNA polymerase sigma-70 factor, ECF subfamily
LDFETALRPCWEDLVRYARALAGSREEGDDLLQNSLLRAWQAYPGLRDRTSFKPWVLSIIRNTYKSFIRLQWVKRMVGLEDAASVPHDAGIPYEEKEVVRMALKTLPLAQRESLILFEVLGMEVAEIATQQKVTISAVKSRLARGRERLAASYFKLSEIETTTERKSSNKTAMSTEPDSCLADESGVKNA